VSRTVPAATEPRRKGRKQDGTLATCRERRRAAHSLSRKRSDFLEKGVEKPVVIVRCAGPRWQELASDSADFGGERTLRPRCVAVRKEKAAQVKSFGDLKGLKIGVSAPGSSTNFFVNAMIARDGVKPDQVAIIGVGTGLSAVAAIKKGEIDAICNLDPVITKLEQDGDIVILADSRTDAGNMKLFGGNNPAAVVYFKSDFITKNPVTVQHLANAFYKAIKWLEKATPEDVAKTVPEEYYLGDKALYLAAVKASQQMYSKTGIITPQGMQNGLNLLLQFDPEMKDAKIDLNRTFDDRFVKKAAAGQM